jgi:hypothetical protein
MVDSDGAAIEDMDSDTLLPTQVDARNLMKNLWCICRRDENTFTPLVQMYSLMAFDTP